MVRTCATVNKSKMQGSIAVSLPVTLFLNVESCNAVVPHKVSGVDDLRHS